MLDNNYINDSMKNLNPLLSLLIINLFLFSCSKPDQSSTHGEAATLTTTVGVFTEKQAELGEVLYVNNCIACQGRDLRVTEGGNALIGERFISKWKGSHWVNCLS